jgi:hypothetical protein
MLEAGQTPLATKGAGIYLVVPEQVWGLADRLMVECHKQILHLLVVGCSQGPTRLLACRAT